MSGQTTILTGPNFSQDRAGNMRVAPAGSPDSGALPLANFLAGTAAGITPTIGLTAHAGGGQANALPLANAMNEVSTVATAADSVSLPLANDGLVVYLRNASATSMQVFGSGTDTINGVATATGVAQAAGVSAIYFCTKSAPAGTWGRVQSS